MGFAFRSPDVVRFLINASKYMPVVVPDMSKPGATQVQVSNIVAEAKSRPLQSRRRVWLHKSVTGMLVCFKNKILDPTQDLHIVFDALSVLKAKTVVRILDIDTKEDATWQLKKTLPSQLNKLLETLGNGVSESDLKVLDGRIIHPEDLIVTDQKVGDKEKVSKTKSFLHTIQDIQSKNADKRMQIEFWICAFYTGMLRDKNHVMQTKNITAKWVPDSSIDIEVYAEKNDKTARQRMMQRAVKGLGDCGLVLKTGTQNKIMELIGGLEHIYIMRGLFLITKKKYSPEKAAHETGANISALSCIARCLFNPTSHLSLSKIHEKELHSICVPKKMLLGMTGKKREEVDESKEKRTRTAVTGREIKPGEYAITELVVAAKLVPVTKTPMQVLAASKTPITTTAKKVMRSGRTLFVIENNKSDYIKFAGKKIKIMGKSAEA